MHGEMAVALLRGINVGGKNLLPMKGLAEIFAEAGCSEVKTYIQSGNVVFRAPLNDRAEGRETPAHLRRDEATPKMGHPEAASLSEAVRDEIGRRYGLKVPVVVRTAAEMAKVVKGDPFVRQGVDAGWMHVMFLADKPTAEMVAGLDAARGAAGEEFAVKGREVYLHLPHGAAKTKLNCAYFDSKLKTIGTQRNWRTVIVLAGMLGLSGDAYKPVGLAWADAMRTA